MSDHRVVLKMLNDRLKIAKSNLQSAKDSESLASSNLRKAVEYRAKLEADLHSIEYSLASLTPPPKPADKEDDVDGLVDF